MAFAVSLWFDEPSENKIREVWRELHLKGTASHLHLGPYRPHVTLAVCESLNVSAFEQHFTRQLTGQPPFQIQFSHVGIFLNDPLVLFLGVVNTRAIGTLRGKALTSLATFGEGLRPHYKLDHWTPHCTLATFTDKAKLTHALSTCDIPASSKITVDRIGIIDTPAEVELSYVAFE